MPEDIFKLLDSRLTGHLEALGFTEPTPIQRLSIPRVLQGESVLLIAPTGHGKTEAAFLPLLHRILAETVKGKGIRLLWITPLRALNRDILRRLVLIARKLEIKAEIRHGDTKISVRRRQTLDPPTLLVTTPETLQALLAGKRMRENLRNIKWVVIDEIHELAASKRGVQLMVALERLREITSTNYQRIGLSATIGNPKRISEFISGGQPCTIIESPATKEFSLSIHYCPYLRGKTDVSPLDGPVEHIWDLIQQHQSTLIFCNERQTAEALAFRLAKKRGDEYGVHHGSLSREARIESEQLFKTGKVPFLVCTSSLELGLDIGTVDLVIQFGSPRQVVRILQRVGRAGHKMDVESCGVIIATRFDDICESIVIAQQALKGQLETPPIHYEAFDILAHQIVGIAIEYKSISWKKIYNIIKRAAPYQSLEETIFHQILVYLEKERLLKKSGEEIHPRRRSFLYYFDNISVIPNIPYRQVINLATGRAIGRLDAGFAEVQGSPGNIIVLRGRPWEVIKQEDDKIFVTSANQIKGKIPRWSGELIPVSLEITRNVGELWQQIDDFHTEPKPLILDVEVNKEAKILLEETITHQKEAGFLPNSQTFFVEIVPNLVIVHSCFGTKINETLGRLLAALVMTHVGIEIVFYADQYRILFRFERIESHSIGEAIIEGLRTLIPNQIRDLLQLILLRSPYFARRFIHVARRFGIISRDVDLRIDQLLQLVRYYTDSPVLSEALREFYIDKLDIDGTQQILSAIQAGKIQIETIYRNKPSTFGKQVLSRFGEFLESETPEAYVIEQTKKRLESRRVKLVCLHCAQWTSIRTIKHLEEKPKCPVCNSRLIAGVYHEDKMLERALRRYRAGLKLEPEEDKALSKGRENADIVLNYGKLALIAMAGRGIGPTVAKRILAATHGRGEILFFRSILEAEKQFIRTREWWAEET